MNLEDLSDEALLQEVLSGDHSAYSVLMRRHEDRIFGLALRMTGDRADALDATQDAFISAFRQAAKFRGESSFGTWLYRIAINATRDLLRKKRRLPEPMADPSDRADGAERRMEDAVGDRLDLGRALHDVPEEYREAVMLHDLGGIPYEEIARLADVPIGTVKSRISRGRRLLAKALEQAAETEASKEERQSSRSQNTR
ncbi:MAG: sigma-70 family RNA polymerase sigma factor [Actinomycetota bacterium]|nr:sigma-70 family RNA polymerase sigma factor [Actinomycetota bacterium]